MLAERFERHLISSRYKPITVSQVTLCMYGIVQTQFEPAGSAEIPRRRNLTFATVSLFA